MTATFIFPTRFPDMNRMIAEIKVHWRKYHKTKKTFTNYAAMVARSKWRGNKPIGQKVNVSILWCVKKTKTGIARDPDNVTHGIKYILDGLVVAGVLMDDSRVQINRIYHDFEYDCKTDSVEVTLEEIL